MSKRSDMTPTPTTTTTTTTPTTIALKSGAGKRVRRGSPWIFSNEIVMTPEAKRLSAGSLVTIDGPEGVLGTAMFNPHTLIAARLLTEETDLDPHIWLDERLAASIALRERIIASPYCRLVHAEGDGLPGLIIDRFGDVLSVQTNTAGMDRLTPDIVASLKKQLSPSAIVLRNDTASRELEGLARTVEVVHGTLGADVDVIENGLTYRADLREGQKTGWFYDHRENRARMAGLAAGARVLDLYAHTGGFAIACAAAGAQEVTAVDRSAAALGLGQKAAAANGLGDRVVFHKGDAFASLEHFARTGETFDIVIADPPAFVKTRKDLRTGIKGYRKLARLCAPVLAPGGTLLAASCSHLADLESFRAQTARGLSDGGREGRILWTSGAGPDHPVHLHLPETAYLKALTISVD